MQSKPMTGEGSSPSTECEVPLVAGIDFGTTQSLVAAKTTQGIELLPDPFTGQAALPSVVWVGKEGLWVGDRAIVQSIREASHTFSSIKRLLGRTTEELAELFKNLPYDVSDSEEGTPELKTDQGGIHPVEFVEEILRALKTRVEVKFRRPLSGAVLTVPAYFDEVQRKCIKDAAHLAEIRVMRLLNEPTAAALSYLARAPHRGQNRPFRLAVYDFGGGTFDISILQVYRSFIEVLATGGDTLLGGDDLDSALAQCLQNQWAETFPSVLLGKSEIKRQRQQFLRLASKIKIGLSKQTQVEAQYGRWRVTVKRETFDELATPIIEKTLEIVSDTLERAHCSIRDCDEILLIGGPTRLPLIRRMVGAYFEKAPNTECDPEGAVAMGAALHAESLMASEFKRTKRVVHGVQVSDKREGHYSPQQQHHTLLDVTPLSFGLETLHDKVEVIIPRNTPIPASCTHRFTNASDNQTQIPFHIVQGESDEASKCRSLAKFLLTDLPPRSAGALDILVQFSVDSSGLLTVSVQESASGRSHTLMTQPTYRIPTELLEELEEAQEELGDAPVAKGAAEGDANPLRELAQFMEYIDYRVQEHASRPEQSRLWPESIHQDLQRLKSMMSEGAPLEEVQSLYRQLKKAMKPYLLYSPWLNSEGGSEDE